MSVGFNFLMHTQENLHFIEIVFEQNFSIKEELTLSE